MEELSVASGLRAEGGAAQLPEQRLEPVRRKTQLHRVQISGIERQLPAGETRRTAHPGATAGLRAVPAGGPGCREASEALALARPQVEVLAPGLRAQLGAGRVLEVTGRAQV